MKRGFDLSLLSQDEDEETGLGLKLSELLIAVFSTYNEWKDL